MDFVHGKGGFPPGCQGYAARGAEFSPDFQNVHKKWVSGRARGSLTANMECSDLLDALRRRYATKHFDAAREVPDDVLRALVESLVLTPSSYGLQPWKFVLIRDRALREGLVAHSYGQRQVADASFLVVMAARVALSAQDVDRYIGCLAEARGVEPGAFAAFRRMVAGDLLEGARADRRLEWARNQVYLALGQFLLAVAEVGLDACPMEGFLPEEYDRILGLTERGWTSVVACPVGYRDAADKSAELPKVRFPVDEVVEWVPGDKAL